MHKWGESNPASPCKKENDGKVNTTCLAGVKGKIKMEKDNYGTVGTGTVVTTAYNMDSDKTKILSFSIQQIAS